MVAPADDDDSAVAATAVAITNQQPATNISVRSFVRSTTSSSSIGSYYRTILTMVSRGFSHAAASLLVLAMGSSAFLPAKLMSTPTGVAAPTRTTSAIEKLESCDDLMKRHPGKVSNIEFSLLFV